MPTASFDYFVVFAEMRTGSNFLETNLNAFDGLACHGEAFNPHFIGYPNSTEILGVTQAMREADPARLIEAVKADPGKLGGFRYFHDHDPRVLDLMLEDPRCAKIILTRNPLDSYVSWKIARQTGQWKLTNVKRRKEAKAQFDAAEFAVHVGALQDFQVTLLNRLQALGQTAFYVAYEDLQSLEVMNGLARWLGGSQQLEALDESLKRQNPAPVLAKVANPDEMQAALAGMDRFNLTRTPNFEPRRGPAVPGYVAGVATPLLYLPLKGGPEAGVVQWMAALDHVAPEGLIQGMNQKQLRQWKRGNKGFRSFTVLRHPAVRAHAVFCRRILNAGEGSYRQIRNTLRRQFKLPIPEEGPGAGYSRAQHREAFAGFLEFVQASLAGQTSVRLDAEWATQSQALAGFAELGSPDLLIRENEMGEDLPALARKLGRMEPGAVPEAGPDEPIALADIYDADLEALIASVYQRDYLAFGFGAWRQE
ncbi:sulfotransferase family 2 domain-containing protein [Leisingera sp. McT4-56]|uniref:sulfotransferase family 2 domain-containing protein n=1 Tax=Leisingera sp. McT4-56 TaxID=2881255 RepID=UPI001CF7F35B|nr:sulfotransferase family 2 domain-containing protein [Leisingera sp. McT4-56]MCB4457771.1 nodulation protein NodH [Leisingera sp. McT4-56]